MPENGVEVVGGLAQSRDPEMYKLPPVADWAVQAVPGENGGESPILYSVALADLSVRQALIAVGDALVPANNGNGKAAKTLDLTRLSPEQIEEAMEGAEKIRYEKDLPAEVRQPVLDLMKAAKNGNRASTDDAKVRSSEADVRPKSKRMREREEKNRQREESQRQHTAERNLEFDQVLAWKEEHPAEITESFFTHQHMLGSSSSPNGKLLITEGEELSEAIDTRIREIMEDPQILMDEIYGEFYLSGYLETHDMPVTSALYSHYNRLFAQRFMDATYDGPQETKQAFKAWSGIFANFSEEYKQSLGYGDEAREPELFSVVIDGPETRMHALGINMLSRSFEKVAESDAAAFIDLVHEAAGIAFDTDTGDDFIRTNYMHMVSTLMSGSTKAAINIINAPILESLDEERKLKAVDFMLALRELPDYNQPMGYIKGESKEFRKHDKKLTNLVKRHGLSGEEKQNSRLYAKTAGTFMEAVRAGELDDSLYLRMQKSNSPEDA